MAAPAHSIHSALNAEALLQQSTPTYYQSALGEFLTQI